MARLSDAAVRRAVAHALGEIDLKVEVTPFWRGAIACSKSFCIPSSLSCRNNSPVTMSNPPEMR